MLCCPGLLAVSEASSPCSVFSLPPLIHLLLSSLPWEGRLGFTASSAALPSGVQVGATH